MESRSLVRRLLLLPGLVLAMTASTTLAAPPAKTFVAVLTADAEVPLCAQATNAARGVATFHVRDEATGTIDYTVVANNLPGNITAAHIHRAPAGVAGPVVQPLALTPGAENGVVGRGSFTNPTLLAELRANPTGYYVNVHSTVCPPGVIRGQLGEHGP